METTHSPQKTKEFVEKEFNEVLLPSLMSNLILTLAAFPSKPPPSSFSLLSHK